MISRRDALKLGAASPNPPGPSRATPGATPARGNPPSPATATGAFSSSANSPKRRGKHHAIAFVHVVTGPCALRRVAPLVKQETAMAALPYAWQAAAAIYATYARKEDDGAIRPPALSRAELAARAAKCSDEHAIKFTEVLLDEHALTPDPVYLSAAADAIQRL